MKINIIYSKSHLTIQKGKKKKTKKKRKRKESKSKSKRKRKGYYGPDQIICLRVQENSNSRAGLSKSRRGNSNTHFPIPKARTQRRA